MTFLITLFARWGLPESFRRPLAILTAVVAAFALIAVLKGCYDRSVVKDYEAGVQAEVQATASAAASEAAKAVESTSSRIEAGNVRASEAAKGSSDPLRDAARALKKE